MKFTDGFWLLREGVTALHATHLQKVEQRDNGLRALVAPRVVEHRGATLNSALFELEFSSPLAGVIGVRVRHHRGGEDSLSFDLIDDKPATQIKEDDKSVQFSSGALTAKLSKSESFNLEFLAADKVITQQRAKGISIFNDGDSHYLSAQLNLGVGELVYGLGERFTAFAKNGQSVDIWNADGGTSSEQAYKNIPFYLTNRGYGVFVNNTGKVSFEVASETVEKVQFSAQTQDLQYFVIYGPTPAEILEKYTALTGRAPQLPEWSFGLWLSTSFVTDYDEQTVTAFIDEMEKREIPLDVFHFDCFWMREYQWCDFEWDPRTFPEPAAMLSRLKAKGLKISLWINPYIGQASPLFDEGKANGYFLKRHDGSVWQWDLWQAGNAIVDFTNPAARDWFKSKLRPLLEMGVDCFKTDFGERIPTDVTYFNGADPVQMHNLYTQLYNATVWELLQEVKGADAIVFARSATAGGQKMPVHWGGDNTSSFESMAESLRGGLSLSLSGFGYWSHDIGGFEGHPDPAVFKRWLAFGLLSSHSRLHGNESVRVPWSIDEEAVDVTRVFVNLKKKLHPYLIETMREVTAKGLPMMRPMLLAFPEDPTAWFLDQQYMLGPDLLVAPVFSASGEVTFYLPAGKWRNYFTDEEIEGGRWISESHGFTSLPLYVRNGGKL
ncbi:MAG: alpha-xylosidase [Actinomycetota bacterium]|jgi:alpha-D-xyloside xylohydrolase